jgi:hypothetical protein
MTSTTRREKAIAAVVVFLFLTGIALLAIAGILAIFPIHEDVLKMIDPSFKDATPCNVDLIDPIIKPGDNAQLTMSGSSLGGEYYCGTVMFTPDDTSLGVWEGTGTSDYEDTHMRSSSSSSYKATLSIPIPNDPNLEGRTITGTFKGVVVYPIKYSGVEWKLTNKVEEKPLSIKIFSSQEAETYTALTERFNSACLNTWLIFFLGGVLSIGLLLVGLAIAEHRKKGKL